MDPKQAAYAAKMQHWDNLDQAIREKFRSLDLDFDYVLWFQCSMLTDDIDNKIELYRRYMQSYT